MSDEQKAKLRAAALGRKLTPEHRAAIGASLMGNTNRRQVSS
jgi:plasmid stability protein